MRNYLIYIAYGQLTLAGTLHFLIDVVSQYVRGVRPPGPQTTLYFGLNTAYALSQVLFGAMALLIARNSMPLLNEWPALAISFVAGASWLAFSFIFLDYSEPKISVAIYIALLFTATAIVKA